ncbi:MAG: M28 family peptidase [Planctomycetes bacterium]|nr:M28 family peptidase [Planctomycetota bacterium]
MTLFAFLLLAPTFFASTPLGSAATLAPSAAPVASNATSLVEALEAIRADAIRADVFFIASDELGGRDTPSDGQRIAARFLRSRLERLGWQPGAPNGYLYEWTRDELRKLDTDASALTLKHGDEETRLAFGRDYWFYSRSATDSDAAGPATFCGLGSKEDFQGKELAGRWAVCFDSDLAWRDREKAAKAAGAIGLVVVAPPNHVGEPYEKRFSPDVKRLAQGTGGRRSRNDETPFPSVYVTAATLGAFKPESWKLGDDLGITVHENRKLDSITLENVCGFWPGSDPELKKDVIIVSAHYDHVGTSSDGQIYNGADDNGSGTCGLLAIAEALAKHGPLARSVLLMWVSGEEKGLWGSAAWTKNPWLPEGCRPFCDINIDMIGRNAPDMLLITPTKSHAAYNGLVKIAEKVAPLEGFPALGSADEYWERSDHRNFSVNLKIPVTFLFSDVHEDYHKPTDDPDKLDYDKIRRVARMVVRMIGELQAPDVKID